MAFSGFQVERDVDYIPEFRAKIIDLAEYWLRNHQVTGKSREDTIKDLIGAVEDVAIALREAVDRRDASGPQFFASEEPPL